MSKILKLLQNLEFYERIFWVWIFGAKIQIEEGMIFWLKREFLGFLARKIQVKIDFWKKERKKKKRKKS